MTGHISAFPTIAARSAFFGAILALSVVSASETLGQVVPVPDTVRADSAAIVDTVEAVTMPIVRADTTQEVTHTVKKGDTLWDLAQYYLKDPFRWPEIFRRNTDVVENPHWIYPGEIIRIWGDQVRPEALASADSAGNVVSHIVTVPTPQAAPIQQSGGPDLTIFASPLSRAAAEIGAQLSGRGRTSAVRRGEVEAAPYVDRRGGPAGPGKLVASVDRPGIASSGTEPRFQLNDQVYFDPPRGFVARVGDRYLTYVLGEQLADVGQVVVPTGIVRVESVVAGQPAKVRIIRQFGEVRLQQGLIPFSDVILPTMSTNPIAGGSSGKVLYIHNDPVLPSIGHYVVLSPNARSGIQVGDEFSFIDAASGRRDVSSAPPVSAGTAQAVRVTPFGTTAIIISQVQPTIREGMSVQVIGKMP